MTAGSLTWKSVRRYRLVRGILPAAVLAGLVVVWMFLDPIRNWLTMGALLKNDAPLVEVLKEAIVNSPDPSEAILAAWGTGKIVHREVAIRLASSVFTRPLSSELEDILLTGALDPDMNVREAGLAGLSTLRHPDLAALAVAQLSDPDPQVRLLGLKYLKDTESDQSVRQVVRHLEDRDPRVVGMSVKILEKWAGTNFGVRLADTVPVGNSGFGGFRAEGVAKTQAAAERANAWWLQRESEFPTAPLEVPLEAVRGRKPIAAAEFSLPGLKGKTVRLSDYRGKVVLLNFWTTWCTACAAEMPALVELQERYPKDLVVIGISLDLVPDSHGHRGGPGDDSGGLRETEDYEVESRSRILEEIARTVEKRGLNYPVLVDEKNEVGGRFNGGELPTTVIVDGEGWVRRRFVGARSLPVFEAMIAEAREPSRM